MRKHYRVNGAPARTMIEHAKETQPVAAEPASAEPVEISLPVFAPYQSNAAETEVMKPVHVAPVKTVPAQMAPAQAQPVTRSVAQAVSQPSPVSVMSEQPVTAQPSPAPLSPPTPPKPAPPLTVVMPDVPNFNVNVTGGITPRAVSDDCLHKNVYRSSCCSLRKSFAWEWKKETFSNERRRKRDTPTSSLTQAGDIVDTFWDIANRIPPVWMATRKLRPCRRRMAVIQPLRSVNYRCFLALIKPTNPLLSRLLTMQALMTSRPTWWHNQSSRNAR